MPNCTFTPPVDQAMAWQVDYFGNTPADADPLAIRLMGYFAPGRRASNVYVMEDGTVTTQQPPNWDPFNPDAPYARVWNYAGSTRGVPFEEDFTHPPNLRVRHVYWGGHDNPVYPEDEDLLKAAGYLISCIPEGGGGGGGGGGGTPPPSQTAYPSTTQTYPAINLFPIFSGVLPPPMPATWMSSTETWGTETSTWADA